MNEKLLLLVYDELNETERAEVEAHLLVCSACQQELVSLQNFKADVPPINISDEMLQPTRRALFYKLRSAASESRQQTSPWWGFGKLALQAGLAIALIFFGFKLGDQKSNPSQPAFAMQDLLTAASTISTKDGTISPQLIGIDKISINPDGTVEISYNTVNSVHIQGRGDDPAVQQMLQFALLTDDDPIVQQRAVKTVQQLVNSDLELDPLYFDAFERILHDNVNLGVKLTIIDILAYAKQPQAQEMLVSLMLKDANEAVRIRAFRALTQGNQHVAELENVLSAAKTDTNIFIRTKSMELLQQNKGTSL
jgi:hypothetical protein